MSDTSKPTQVDNIPGEFNNIPIEPPVGNYVTLRKSKSVHDVTSELDRFPRFSKDYYSILSQDYYDVSPSVSFYDTYNKLNSITDDEEFRREYTALIPQSAQKRIALNSYLSAEQRHQLKLLNQRYTIITLPEYYEEKSKKPSHTMNRKLVLSLFDSPNPDAAAKAFPAIPASRREKWYDLTLHFLRVSYSDTASDLLLRCFERPHRLLRGTRRGTPCRVAGTGIEGGYNYWGDVLVPNKTCGQYTQHLRRAMVEQPNFEQARYYFNRITSCMASQDRFLSAHASVVRNEDAASVFDLNLTHRFSPVFASFQTKNAEFAYHNQKPVDYNGPTDDKTD